jgi:hypothetical protein
MVSFILFVERYLSRLRHSSSPQISGAEYRPEGERLDWHTINAANGRTCNSSRIFPTQENCTQDDIVFQFEIRDNFVQYTAAIAAGK